MSASGGEAAVTQISQQLRQLGKLTATSAAPRRVKAASCPADRYGPAPDPRGDQAGDVSGLPFSTTKVFVIFTFWSVLTPAWGVSAGTC
jgi:hypothetical protein